MQTMPSLAQDNSLNHPDAFIRRHLGPSEADIAAMLATLGYDSLDALGRAAVPASIQLDRELDVGAPHSEYEVLDHLREIASGNEVWRSYICTRYHGCFTPPVILPNILENPRSSRLFINRSRYFSLEYPFH